MYRFPLARPPTPLIPWEEAKTWGFDRVDIKDESVQPTGTWKDRKSDMVIRRAVRMDIQKIAIISAGNAAYSLAQAAKPVEGMKIVPM